MVQLILVGLTQRDGIIVISSYPGSPTNGNSDTVLLDTGGGVDITLNTSPITIASLTVGSAGGAANGASVILNGNTLNVTGAVTIHADGTGGAAKAITVGTGTLAVTGLITIKGNSVNGYSEISASTGVITAAGGITFTDTAANAQLNTSGAATINLTGTVSSGGTLAINAATTLVSTGTSAINVAGTWGKLSLPSGTLTLGGVAVTFAGTTDLTGGTLAVSSATGTKTFTGAVTCTTGSFDLSGFATVTSFAAGITANCTTFNTGTGTATLSATQALAGSTSITFGGALTVSAGTTTNNNTGTVTATGALTLTGNWAQGANSSLTMGSTNSGSGTFDASTNTPNTVTYTATATLKAPTSSYYNLTITGGTVTSVAATVANDLVVSGGTFSGASNITVNGGDVTGDGTITMTGGIFLVDAAGNFGGATAWTFYNLTFGDGSGTTTTTATGAGAITATGVTTVAANQTLDAGSKTWNIGVATPPTSPAFVQSAASTSSTDLTNALTGVTAGNLIVAFAKWEGSSGGTGITSITDGTSNFTLGTLKDNGTDMHGQMAWLLSANGGDKTYTLSINGTESFVDWMVMEFSTSGQTITLDQQNTNSGSSATCSSGNITLGVTGEGLVVGTRGSYNTGTWTNRNINNTAATGTLTGHSYASMWYSFIDSGILDADASHANDLWTCHIASFNAGTAVSSNPLVVSGTFTANASTVAFKGDGATNINALTYYNLTLSPTITAARAYTFASGTTTVGGAFDIVPSAGSALALTVNLGGTLNVTGSTTIERASSATSTLDTLSASNYALSSGSINIATGGTFTPNNSVVTLTGTSGTLFTKTGTLTTVGTTSQWDVTSASGSPTLLSAATSLHILKINAAATVINLGAALTTDNNSGNKLWIASGVLNQENQTITAGTAGTLQIDSGGTLCLGGTTGATNATCDSGVTQTTAQSLPTFTTYTINSASTVIYLSNAATTVTALSTPGYGNLTLRPKLTADRAYTLGNSLLVAGALNSIPTTGSFALTTTLTTGGLTVTGLTTVQGSTSTSTLDTSSGNNYAFSTGSLSIASGSTLNIRNSTLTVTGTSGTLFTRAGTFTIGGTSTTVFSGNGDATLNSGTITFDAMTNSGTGTKTLGAAIATGGALTISAGTLQLSTFDLTANSTTSLSGTLNDDSATGTNLFVGGVTINSGGVWTTSNNPAFEFRGGLTNNSSSGFTSGTGTYTFSTNAQTVSGSQSFTITNLTNSITSSTGLTFSGAQPTVTTLTQGSSAQLTFSGSMPTITTLTATASGNTVSYTSTAGAQTVISATYVNVIIDKSGQTATLGGALDVNDTLTITAGALDVSGSNFGITAKSWTDAGSGTFTEGTGTVTFDVAGGTINSNETFENVTINHAGTTTLGVALDLDDTLTLSGGALDVSGTNFAITAKSWTDTGSGTFTEGTGTVTFDVAGGTINSNETFNSVAINHAGTTTLGASLIVGDDMSITSGTLDVSGSSHAIAVGGDWVNDGAFTSQSGTVTFSGSGTQTIDDNNTWYGLAVTASAARTVKFESSKTQTIKANGSLTFTGASGQILTISPKTAATTWLLTVNNTGVTQSVSYITPSYSDASGGAGVTANNGTNTNGGNNTNWNFNTVPSFSAGPSDSGSTSSPINVGSNVTFTGTATDPQSENYYLAICKTNAISANDNAVPTCTGGNWAISSSTTSGSQASVTYTTLSGDAETNAWYAFVCDHATFSICSSSSQGSGSNGSPFEVNHAPSFSAIVNTSGSIAIGSAVTFTATASDSDTNDTADTVSLYVCKSSDFASGACGAGGTWCSSSADSSDPDCSYTILSSDTAGSHTYYAYIIDNHSFESTSNPRSATFTSAAASSDSGSSGSTVTSSGSRAANELPGNFSVTINNGQPSTNSRNVTLSIKANADVQTMIISNDPTFANAAQEPYQPTKTWLLGSGQGLKTVYVKLLDKYGLASKVFSTTIDYQPNGLIDSVIGIIKPPVDKIIDILSPGPQPIVFPPIEEAVKKEAPLALRGQWDLFSCDSMCDFLFAPLPTETRILAQKLPEIGKLFKETGITTANAVVQRLQGVELTIPGLAQRTAVQDIDGKKLSIIGDVSNTDVDVPKFEQGGVVETELESSQFILPKNIPLADFSTTVKNLIPTEIVFARTANELIDFNIGLSLNEHGKLEQKIDTLSSQPIKLAVKPEGAVYGVKGYLIMGARKPRESAFQTSLQFLSASLLFSNPKLALSSEGTLKVEPSFLVEEFEYQDQDYDGIYTATVNAPAVEGEYEVITVMNYKDIQVGNKEIRLIVVVDPEGYVYSNVMGGELRVNGAIVSLYWLNPVLKKYELWPSDEFQQTNPQITDKTGKYAFLVPEGLYYIEVSAPNYSMFRSEVITVKEGNGIHMNIELKSKRWWLAYFDLKIILIMLLMGVFGVLFYLVIIGKIKVTRYR